MKKIKNFLEINFKDKCVFKNGFNYVKLRVKNITL